MEGPSDIQNSSQLGDFDDLESNLASLKEAGAHLFDPVRFCYIESLAKRASKQRKSVARPLQQKAFDALCVYQVDLASAQQEAEECIVHCSTESPNDANRLQQHFDQSDFNGVRKQYLKLQQRNESLHIQNQLATLTALISIGHQTADNHAQELSFDDLLRQQETEVLRDFSTLTNASHSQSLTKPTQPMELRSARLFRESWEQRNSDKMINRAFKNGPKDPGPLNAHGLAIRSLSIMQQLSPSYLKRFVSYIDTLLSLEQAITKPKSKRK